jgi:transcriptional regulator with PAS, ATPase and Fis domain
MDRPGLGRIDSEERAPRATGNGGGGFDAIIGSSPRVLVAKTLLARVAASRATTVLLTGETGTGKDLAAKTIHVESARAPHPFVNITCSAMPPDLLESELFGHERGAFTDARWRKPGLLEMADGGTVFLDEISSMGPGLQAKLLRFFEERTFKRVGGLEDIHVDVRIVAATNCLLGAQVADGAFREDLFYRLQVMPIFLPPLRDRVGDIPLLAAHYVGRYNTEFGMRVRGLTPEAIARLEGHAWPGNVRELRNTIERAMLLLDDEWIGPESLDLRPEHGTSLQFRLPAQGVDLREVERQLLVQALQRTHGNHTLAGRLLGINRDQVRYRIEKFGLPRASVHAAGRDHQLPEAPSCPIATSNSC